MLLPNNPSISPRRPPRRHVILDHKAEDRSERGGLVAIGSNRRNTGFQGTREREIQTVGKRIGLIYKDGVLKVGERNVRKFVCLVIRFPIPNEGEDLWKIAGLLSFVPRSCIIFCGVDVLPTKVFARTCLEAFPKCVSSWPRHL